MTKSSVPLGRLFVGSLLAMPTATYLLNRLRGYDPRKAMRMPTEEPVPEMRLGAYGELAARLAARQALMRLESPGSLFQPARGLREYRRIYA